MNSWLTNKVDSWLDKEMSNGVPSNTRAIDKHLDKFFYEDEVYVLHEETSETVHSDIFVIKPEESEGRDYYILLTSGMSALPMDTHEGYRDCRYGELMMLLPNDWNMNHQDFENEENWWPMRLLIGMTKYPHEENTWLGHGHTYGNQDEKSFSTNARFSAAILVESITVPESFLKIKRNFGRDIYVYSVIPIYQEELEYKLLNGTDALLNKFQENDIEEIIRIDRINTCK